MRHPISRSVAASPFPIARKDRGFSLIELVTVMALMTMLLGVAGSSVRLFNSGGLTNGARLVSGLLTVARNEAIARHTVVRFAVAAPTKSGNDPAALRKVSLWAWDREAEIFTQISKWEELPDGVSLEPQLPDYVKEAAYATKDPGAARGDCVLDAAHEEEAEFAFANAHGTFTTRYLEFLPSGNVKIPGGKTRQAVLVTTEGHLAPGATELTYTGLRNGRNPARWAQINVDTFTGRVRLYQP